MLTLLFLFFVTGLLSQTIFVVSIFEPVILQNDIFLLAEWTIISFALSESRLDF